MNIKKYYTKFLLIAPWISLFILAPIHSAQLAGEIEEKKEEEAEGRDTGNPEVKRIPKLLTESDVNEIESKQENISLSECMKILQRELRDLKREMGELKKSNTKDVANALKKERNKSRKQRREKKEKRKERKKELKIKLNKTLTEKFIQEKTEKEKRKKRYQKNSNSLLFAGVVCTVVTIAAAVTVVVPPVAQLVSEATLATAKVVAGMSVVGTGTSFCGSYHTYTQAKAIFISELCQKNIDNDVDLTYPSSDDEVISDDEKEDNFQPGSNNFLIERSNNSNSLKICNK